jgi:hypothetical protein
MLEVTADEFPERVKALLQSNVLFLLNSKEARPDLFGHIGPDCTEVYGRGDFLMTVEVKPGVPTIHDIFQAKKYGELYWVGQAPSWGTTMILDTETLRKNGTHPFLAIDRS